MAVTPSIRSRRRSGDTPHGFLREQVDVEGPGSRAARDAKSSGRRGPHAPVRGAVEPAYASRRDDRASLRRRRPMRVLSLVLVVSATSLAAQDTSFSRLHVRAGAMRLPVTGHIADDWQAGTGAQVEAGSNVGRGELALGLGRMGFESTTGKPAFSTMFFSLAWTGGLLRSQRMGVNVGVRLSDVFMNFNDLAQVIALRHEEEMMISAVGRGRVAIGRGFNAFAEATYGSFMLSTRTPVASVAVGIGREGAMPGWLRDFLR